MNHLGKQMLTIFGIGKKIARGMLGFFHQKALLLIYQLAESARVAGQKRNLVWGPNFTRARS
jgi:hypothetical protein